jgi:hypothetical protein
VPLEVRYEAEDYPVNYLIAEGQGENRKIVEVTGAKLMKKPVPVISRPRPYAYVLPREATEAVALLRRHGITVEQLMSQTSLDIAAYTVAGVSFSQQYNHAAAASIEVGEVLNLTRNFPAGSYVVRTAQMQGRVAVHLLEPESTDNVIYWNRMDAWVPRPGAAGARGGGAGRGGGGRGGRGGGQATPPLVPIFKVMAPTPMPLRIITN